MYYSHFGLNQAPFKITPNTEFFFSGGNRGPILEALIYAITHGEGIIKVTGEVGSGKTMLCHMLPTRLPPHIETVYIANPSVSPEEILHAIAFELQLDIARDALRLQVMQAIHDFLLKRYGEGKRVVVFDHTLRTADDELRESKQIREVVRRVHNDYTEWSAPQRVRDILPDEAEQLLQQRFAIIQVWRPIHHPVETYPLAMADAQTLSPQDMILSERRAPGRIGQTYAIKYNPEHKWYWFPRMRRDEALVFKVYDSLDDGRARWTAHTAFDDPTAPPNARPRESIEIRTLAFF